MAKIGNETNLVLKLAKERVKNSPRLEEEIRFRTHPGNHPEKFKLSEAITCGYNLGIKVYKETLDRIVAEIQGN